MTYMTILSENTVASTISIADAKARFSALLRRAEEGAPVLITRHGKPVAAVVAAEDLARLERLRAAGPEGGLASVAGGWDDSAELADILSGLVRVGVRNDPPLE